MFHSYPPMTFIFYRKNKQIVKSIYFILNILTFYIINIQIAIFRIYKLII